MFPAGCHGIMHVRLLSCVKKGSFAEQDMSDAKDVG